MTITWKNVGGASTQNNAASAAQAGNALNPILEYAKQGREANIRRDQGVTDNLTGQVMLSVLGAKSEDEIQGVLGQLGDNPNVDMKQILNGARQRSQDIQATETRGLQNQAARQNIGVFDENQAMKRGLYDSDQAMSQEQIKTNQLRQAGIEQDNLFKPKEQQLKLDVGNQNIAASKAGVINSNKQTNYAGQRVGLAQQQFNLAKKTAQDSQAQETEMRRDRLSMPAKQFLAKWGSTRDVASVLSADIKAKNSSKKATNSSGKKETDTLANSIGDDFYFRGEKIQMQADIAKMRANDEDESVITSTIKNRYSPATWKSLWLGPDTYNQDKGAVKPSSKDLIEAIKKAEDKRSGR